MGKKHKNKWARLPPMDPQQTSETFFRLYDADYWHMKAFTLCRLIEDAQLAKILHEHENKEEVQLERLHRMWLFEVEVTAFHSTEALFALMWAIRREGKHAWTRLTNYPHHELENFVRQINERGLADFVNPGKPEPARAWFYPFVDDEEAEALKAIRPTLDFIPAYLQRLAAYYKKDDAVYNAWKHGNRTSITSGSFKITPSDGSPGGWESKPFVGIHFIDTEPAHDRQPPRYVMRMEPVRYRRAVAIIIHNTALIHMLIESYKPRPPGRQTYNVKTIRNPDVEQVFGHQPGDPDFQGMSFGMTINHEQRPDAVPRDRPQGATPGSPSNDPDYPSSAAIRRSQEPDGG